MFNKIYLFLSLICLCSLFWKEAIPFEQKVEKRILTEEDSGLKNDSDCRCRDSLALVRIFESTSGIFWTEPWDLDAAITTWKGVTLNDNNCVERLILNNNGLLGFLPPEVEDLSDIKNISMSENQLQGSIPRGFGSLKNLESIVLNNNEYSGIIPEVLSNLRNLQILDLGNNQLFGIIPEALGELSNLSILRLNNNRLEGVIPSNLTALNMLTVLDMSANELSGTIPPNIGDMLALAEISLQENRLNGVLPPSIGNLTQLVTLRLENNQLQDSLPSTWGNLIHLETILLQDNNLEGCFPESFELFCDLNEYTSQAGRGYRFRGNSGLSWSGDFQQFCAGEAQRQVDCMANNLAATISYQNCICIGVTIVKPITVDFIEKATCRNQNSGTINGTISPANAEFRVSWQGAGQRDEIFTNESFEIENLGVGEYEVTIFVATNDSLIQTQKISITEFDCFDVGTLPQLITPNGDGLNDAFVIDLILENPTLFSNNQLTIFNRWGDAVFKAQPYQNDWSGQQQNGQLLPEGTYYYLLKIDLNEGLIYKGDITIVRK